MMYMPLKDCKEIYLADTHTSMNGDRKYIRGDLDPALVKELNNGPSFCLPPISQYLASSE